MTDRQIARVILVSKLRWMTVGHDDVRCYARSKLSERRCARIAELVVDMADKMRAPLVRQLSKAGLDGV
jgi:hypothetical protein